MNLRPLYILALAIRHTLREECGYDPAPLSLLNAVSRRVH